MEEFIRTGWLLGVYGPLLSQRQKDVMDQHFLQDLSLSEIAQNLGITRQAVHELVQRCTKQLEEYEEKLGWGERAYLLTKHLKLAQKLAHTGPVNKLHEELAFALAQLEEYDGV